MTLKRDSHPDLFPRLLPLFGGIDKKPRFLDKDVMAVGRARGCDITLDANEVSAIHCLFYRAVSGFRVRDSGSRTGTRLNGSAVKNSAMADGDVLQIGPFSFEVKLPESLSPPATAAAAHEPQILERVQNSRRNLVRLALHMRRKLRQGPAANGLNDKVADLKAKIRQYDQRLGQLEQSELELVAERQQLEKEKEAQANHVQQVETELAARLLETEEEIRQRWTEFQQRCSAEENRLHALRSAAPAGDAAPLEQLQSELVERERRLKERETVCQRREREARAEFEDFERQQQEIAKERAQNAAEVSKQQAELHQQRTVVELAERSLRDQKSELARMFQELKRLQEEMRHQPRPDVRPLQQENQQLRQHVAELEQRLAADAKRMKAELTSQEQFRLAQAEELQLLREQLAQPERAGAGADPAAAAEAARLQSENDQLRQLLQTQLFKSAKSNDAELREENNQLRQILTEYEQRLAAEPSTPDASTDAQLREENELLRQLLQEKEKAIEDVRRHASNGSAETPQDVRQQLEAQELELTRLQQIVGKLEQQLIEEQARKAQADEAPAENLDLDSLEAELNRERRQIAAERAKLGKEIESLRSRNAELDDATRELEMELSRERAEMARERMRLDRMRDEIKNEIERLQRDGGVRESLASVQRLREDIKTAGTRR